MELIDTRHFNNAAIRIYRHEGKIWMPAHDIERALGLPKEAFGAMVHNDATEERRKARKAGLTGAKLYKEATRAAEKQAREQWGNETMLFGRKTTRTHKHFGKRTGREVERQAEDVEGVNWKMTCEGARRFALKSLAATGREYIFWVDALQVELTNAAAQK